MKDYAKLAKDLRCTVLGMTHRAQSSHIGSNFSCADILTVLYELADFSKDVIIVKSWAAASVYACLVRKGLLPQEAVDCYGEEGTKWTTILEPIPPYIPVGTGAMGYHLPFAVGMALAKKVKKEAGMIYCLISDGECQIGSTWESALIAAQHKLDNLTLIIDWNGFQAMGHMNDILNIEPIGEKWREFGWRINFVDGHRHQDIENALLGEGYVPKAQATWPRVIIARTTKGKGVSFMEDSNVWHYQHVNKQALEDALKELK